MTTALIYALSLVTLGSSWFAIKLQVGIVPVEVSIVYRFVIAAVCVAAVMLATGHSFRLTARQHRMMLLQGLTMFCLNQVLIYWATEDLTSGLVAVAFSSIAIMNIIVGRLLFGAPVRPLVAVGALCGTLGLVLVFWPEVSAFDLDRGGTRGLIFALSGTAVAAFASSVAARNQRAGIPVQQGILYGMTYGAVMTTAIAMVQGRSFAILIDWVYLLSLLYSGVVTTAIGFWCYLWLIGRIGPDRTAYSAVIYPIIALAISTAFEDYRWTLLAAAGVALALLGNVLVLLPARLLHRMTGGRD